MSKLKKIKMPMEAAEMELSESEAPAMEASEEEVLPGSEEAALEEAPSMPLADFSDDDLVAEVVKRGLADELDGQPSEPAPTDDVPALEA